MSSQLRFRLTFLAFGLVLSACVLILSLPGCRRDDQKTSSPQTQPAKVSPQVPQPETAMFKPPLALNAQEEFRTFLQSAGPKTSHASVAKINGVPYKVVSLEFEKATECATFADECKKSRGMYVLTQFDRFAEIMIPAEDVESQQKIIDQANRFKWWEWVAFDVPVPPLEKVQTDKSLDRAGEEIPRGGVEDLTGKGVIIAFLDTGLDFRHPDFVSMDKNGKERSRLLYFWDTLAPNPPKGKEGPVQYPNGSPMGALYATADLTDALHDNARILTEPDANGHGTFCAGIAAGNGRAASGIEKPSDFKGIAPAADIIAVRLGSAGEQVENMWMLNAVCDWLDKKAAELNKALVISCSLGAPQGGRDGKRIVERQLSARFPSNKKGRVLCFAAGNEGWLGRHATIEFNENNRATIKWHANQSERIEVYLSGPSDTDFMGCATEPSSIKQHLTRYFNRNSQAQVLSFVAPPGDGALTLKVRNCKQADAYIDSAVMPSADEREKSSRFENGKNLQQINTPATADSVLAVGSYDVNNVIDSLAGRVPLQGEDGQPIQLRKISRYSNAGSLRGEPIQQGGIVKPDIVAPGQYILTSAPQSIVERWEKDDSLKTRIHQSRRYVAFNGTSAATPYTAGVCALLLERNRDLTLDDLRAKLQAKATKDQFTTEATMWGRGKLDKAAVESLASAVTPPAGK
ncbi:MAG TPA: S8 family serine peptidase [Gemmataceae bacterium]|nr:S8 family serine peptidase [Gemmataceae bacterium]